jgi:hypothetical protein
MRRQAGLRHEMVAGAEEPEQARERVERERLPRRRPREISPSASAVATVCGRDATNAPLSAPAEVPTMRSGAMPRS